MLAVGTENRLTTILRWTFERRELGTWALALSSGDPKDPLFHYFAARVGAAAGSGRTHVHGSWWPGMYFHAVVYAYRAGLTGILPASENDEQALRAALQDLLALPIADLVVALWDASLLMPAGGSVSWGGSLREQVAALKPLAPGHAAGHLLIAWAAEPTGAEAGRLEGIGATWHRSRPGAAWRIVPPAGSTVQRGPKSVTIRTPAGRAVRLARPDRVLPVADTLDWLAVWGSQYTPNDGAGVSRRGGGRGAGRSEAVGSLGWAQGPTVKWQRGSALCAPVWMPPLASASRLAVAQQRESGMELVVISNSATGEVACGQWSEAARCGRVWLPDETDLSILKSSNCL